MFASNDPSFKPGESGGGNATWSFVDGAGGAAFLADVLLLFLGGLDASLGADFGLPILPEDDVDLTPALRVVSFLLAVFEGIRMRSRCNSCSRRRSADALLSTFFLAVPFFVFDFEELRRFAMRVLFFCAPSAEDAEAAEEYPLS